MGTCPAPGGPRAELSLFPQTAQARRVRRPALPASSPSPSLASRPPNRVRSVSPRPRPGHVRAPLPLPSVAELPGKTRHQRTPFNVTTDLQVTERLISPHVWAALDTSLAPPSAECRRAGLPALPVSVLPGSCAGPASLAGLVAPLSWMQMQMQEVSPLTYRSPDPHEDLPPACTRTPNSNYSRPCSFSWSLFFPEG